MSYADYSLGVSGESRKHLGYDVHGVGQYAFSNDTDTREHSSRYAVTIANFP